MMVVVFLEVGECNAWEQYETRAKTAKHTERNREREKAEKKFRKLQLFVGSGLDYSERAESSECE